MAVASASPERIPQQQQQHPFVEPSPCRFSTDSDAASSSPLLSCSAGTPVRANLSSSSSTADQVAARLRSEEYRQLFRLPADEALIEDFNCAFQENILIQGHMYLFVHYICFYSNIFGYETKKIIPFQEVTSVKRAKMAGIFPNALEIFAGDKKYFFASFLFRDEAYRIINDGWAQYVDATKETTDQQVVESISETKNQEKGVVIEKVESSSCLVNESDSTDRDTNTLISIDSDLPPKVEDDSVLTSLSEPRGVTKEDIEPVVNGEPSSSTDWKEEDSDAPKIPEFYTKVVESQFPIKIEDFFTIFYSDDVFIETFHKSCGDKEFSCTSWHPHEKFGHTRNVSSQHPIKIYFGAKFGSCQELQKFRVYRNSHLVIETSQEINDVPYGDYFRVEGLWSVERDTDKSKECCNLKIYLNVAFSKRTVWKGKIVQSTLEECREVFATWINMAHELLKTKNLEKQEESIPTVSMVQKCEVRPTREAKTVQSSEKFNKPSDHSMTQQITASISPKQQVSTLFQESPSDTYSLASWLRESMMKFGSSLRSQSHLSLIIVIFVAVIFIMQLSILALLARPQQIHVHSPVDYTSGVGSGIGGRSSEFITWLEKRVHLLKDELNLVEARLESMRREHALLKGQLDDFKHLMKHK